MIKPDYTRVCRQVLFVFQRYQLCNLPISLDFLICQAAGLKLQSYSDAVKGSSLTPEKWAEFLGSDLGAYISNPANGQAVIYYNDTKENNGLDRFTIAHELGHHFLGHGQYAKGGGPLSHSVSEQEYQALENEANCFARNLLCPIPLIELIGIQVTNEDELVNVFDVSASAARTRALFYSSDKKRMKNGTQHFFAHQFEESVHFYQNLCFCSECGHIFSIAHAAYCPVCGGGSKHFIQRGRRYAPAYTGPKSDERGKLLCCPKCGNGHTSLGDYCPVCGTYLLNQCASAGKHHAPLSLADSCGALLPANARYCCFCGNESTFLQSGFLKPWVHHDKPVILFGDERPVMKEKF